MSIAVVSLPFLGLVAAGWPSPAEEELGDILSFDDWLMPNPNACSLVAVSSPALEGIGVLPGDIAIVERGRTPQPGDIVVVRNEGETTLRQYEKAVEVLGVVTAIIRKYR